MIRRWLHALYHRLPVVREIRRLDETINRVEDRFARYHESLQAATMVQSLNCLRESNPRYRDTRRLMVHGAQYWSQNYEDGMIAEIFRRIQVSDKTFLEVGVGDGSENNTTALLMEGWQGAWIEGNPDSCTSIRQRLAGMPSFAKRLKLREAFVSPENIASLLQELKVPAEIDLFSLDIDQDTYHIWSALPDFKPRVVVVEYNAGIPPHCEWVNPYVPGQLWNYTQQFGASLKSFELLGRRFGYSLVGCDILGANAFFVRNDFVGDHFAAPFTSEEHFEPPRYGMLFRWGHRSAFYGESNGSI